LRLGLILWAVGCADGLIAGLLLGLYLPDLAPWIEALLLQ
jgi:hypothetical protein